MRDATLASIRRLLVEHPPVSADQIGIMAACAAGVGRPLSGLALIDEFAEGYPLAQRLQLYELQMLIASDEQDHWHALQAADRILALQPDHNKARQFRSVAIGRLRQELARLSQE